MTDFDVKPLPAVTITDADAADLPIASFQLAVIVEPDPESYMPLAGDLEKLAFVLYDDETRFDTELNPENPHYRQLTGRLETDVIWLKYDSEPVGYFNRLAEIAQPKADFQFNDREDTEHLEYYLRGLYAQHPDWQVVVIGGMYEDEVMRMANLLAEVGFATTVLTRYCLSNQVFLNLDHFFAHDQWVRTAGLKEDEPYRSWLEEWMEEHGVNFNGEDAPDNAADKSHPSHVGK